MWLRWSVGLAFVLAASVSVPLALGANGPPHRHPVANLEPSPSSSAPSLSPAVQPSPPVSPGPSPKPAAGFGGTLSKLPVALAARMNGTTWQPGCPVPLRDLRLLRLSSWGFDGQVHEGELVVRASVASDVVSVFRTLLRAHFPIHDMHLAATFRPNQGPNDPRDWTAGFNCRPIVTATGPGTGWSQHSYGLAIDINPIENPFATAEGTVENRYARPYADRNDVRPGMVTADGVVVRAFAAIGWTWGGSWSGAKDYMHFSQTGR